MELQTVKFEVQDSAAWITLNRPKEMNAINTQLAADLLGALLACESDAKIRAVILTGAGRAFCAGGDVPRFHAEIDNAEFFLRKLTRDFHACITQITRMNKPVIAAINGITAGGGLGFAVAADLAIAAEGAKFTMAYTGIGATPDGGTTYFLPRLIGARRTMELTLLNRMISAAEALNWGLVNQVVPDEKLVAEAGAVAARLVAGPAQAYAGVKRLLNQTHLNTLEAQLESESRSISAMGATPDFREGVRAFIEKRKPEFNQDAQ